MADFKDSTADTYRASKAQLLALGDRMDNARYAVIAARLASLQAIADLEISSAVGMLFLRVEKDMADIAEEFDRLLLAPHRSEHLNEKIRASKQNA